MTTARPFDPSSVVDQLLSGHLPTHPRDRPVRPLTTEELAFLEDIRTWCDSTDLAAEIESSQQIPTHMLDDLGRLGAFRIIIPEQHGGLGFSDDCLLAVLAVLTSAHSTLCEVVAAHQVIGAVRPLLVFGTDEQQAQYLPELTGQVSAFALNESALGYGTEPLTTTAHYDPVLDCYLVTGSKTWITNAPIASHVVVLVDLMPTQLSGGGVTALLVKASDDGVARGPGSSFAGLRGLPNGQLNFDDARIPADRLIGTEGAGFDVALTCLSKSRAALPVVCLATMTTCLADAAAWVREDRQTRRGLHTNPQIQRHLARLMTLGLIANAVTWFVLDPHCADTDAEAAKLILSESAAEATDILLQLVGGRGYETAESARRRRAPASRAERLWRDTRVTRIFDGSTEMLKDMMAQPFSGTPPLEHTTCAPSDEQMTILAVQAAHLRDIVRRHDDQWVRAAALDCVLDMFTFYCVRRFQQELGETEQPITGVWEVTTETLTQRIALGLESAANSDRLAKIARLATELTSRTAAHHSPALRRPLAELGVHR
ncbi:acyl-CoA dehydrogenase family protein [Rhodococcus sp. IEGM 1330]|uniref:acyl-CoA dehydrogenase family protein n=1 Tax=Rhodococcus sp. IEGM 1330 TaxID=3082225 RepID=UPI002954DBB8|nr:acyl-CoA dehydrogenase family protein [Rhodococcus sp. IEGM 1330]MDV8022658.1 acyl-CoA dehydrogenase family protein [Rhodococcus sp. IEGM 1330]